MQKTKGVAQAEDKRQAEIQYLKAMRRVLKSIGGFDPEFSNSRLPEVEQKLGELKAEMKAERKEARLEEALKRVQIAREGKAEVQSEEALRRAQVAKGEAQSQEALGGAQVAKEEKKEAQSEEALRRVQITKEELTWKERWKIKLSGSWLGRLWDALDTDEKLFDARVGIQRRFKSELEKKWKEPVVSVIFHSHNSGAENGYKGSPDGVFKLDTQIPRLVRASGADAIFITDHDAFEPEQMKKLAEAIDAANKSQKSVALFSGTELTSARDEGGVPNKGHFVIMQAGKPLEKVPEPNSDPLAMARWAFANDCIILVPHPNPSRWDVKRMFQPLDISLEREQVEEILREARKHGKYIFIACRNGTSSADYRERLLGSRERRWQFLRSEKVPEETRKLYEERAIFIAESDGHIKCEFPSGMVFFRRKDVVGADGKVSSQKIYETLAKWKQEEKELREKGIEVTLENSRIATHFADDEFGSSEKLAKGVYFFKEYLRLAGAWMKQLFTGKIHQLDYGPPKRKPHAEYRKFARMQFEED